MKTVSIFSRYLFIEMMPPFAVNIMFFTLVFLLTQILDITNMIVNYQIGMGIVLLLLLYSMPFFLVFVTPMSVMVAVLLTFLRMSNDNEILAMKSCGISLYALVPSVSAFCFIGCLLTGFMSIFGVPWGEISLKKLTIEVASSHIDIGLKERTFNDSFKDVMLYVNKIDIKSKALIDVFIEDQRSKNLVITIVSPKGELFAEPGKPVFHLRLFSGIINQVNLEDRSVNSIEFDTYEVNLDMGDALASARSGTPKDEKEMTLSELRQYLKETTEKNTQYYVSLLEFHKKFSIPFACFALGLLAVPLGLHSKSARRSFGLGLGLAFFLLYYLLLSAGMVFGEAGVYPPVIGMWMPNIVIGGIGLWLLIRSVNDRPVSINILPGMMKRFAAVFKRNS